jgi:hypothetical protein
MQPKRMHACPPFASNHLCTWWITSGRARAKFFIVWAPAAIGRYQNHLILSQQAGFHRRLVKIHGHHSHARTSTAAM